MGIISRSSDVDFGQVGSRRLSRNRVDSSGGWLGEIMTIEAKFKLVYRMRIGGI
jgi:hypothetical protein